MHASPDETSKAPASRCDGERFSRAIAELKSTLDQVEECARTDDSLREILLAPLESETAHLKRLIRFASDCEASV